MTKVGQMASECADCGCAEVCHRYTLAVCNLGDTCRNADCRGGGDIDGSCLGFYPKDVYHEWTTFLRRVSGFFYFARV